MKEFFVRKLLGAAGTFLFGFLGMLKERGTFDRVLDLAKLYTTEAEQTGLPGPEKRKIAFDGIKNSLAGAGQTASTVAINLAIELAVAYLTSQIQKK